MKIAVTYANIQNGGRDSKPREVVEDAQTVAYHTMTRRFSRKADLCGFNEIVEEPDKAGVKLGVGKTYDHAHMGTPNPQFWLDHRFREIWRDSIELSPVWPGENPARSMSCVALDSVVPWGPEFEWVNLHLTNGGFNDEHPDTKQERRTRWQKEDHSVSGFIQGRHGIRPMIVTGDFNRIQVKRYTDQMQWIHGMHGIIKMAVIPNATWDIEVLDTDVVGLNSDKPALGALLEFKRR